MSEKLTGQIRRIVFRNENNGYIIASLKPAKGGPPATVVGRLPGVAVGETIECAGRWETDLHHGRQFRVDSFTARQPTDADTIRRYLGSGLIKGIGPKLAGELVDRFGVKTLEIIERQPKRLREVPGIGRARAQQITDAWRESRDIREIGLLLEKAGAPRHLVLRVRQRFAEQAADVVRHDPYRLVAEVRGIGFLTADRIARGLGVAEDDPARLRAGLLHTLNLAAEVGHTALPLETLTGEAAQLLHAPPEKLDPEIERLVAAGHARREKLAGRIVLAPTGLALAEQRLAAAIVGIQRAADRFRAINRDKAVAWVQQRLKIELTERQREAAVDAIEQPLLVVTGGPGTGKTTIVRSICEMVEAMKRTVALCAPTGRAAKRLAETTGREAKTVHRLLEINPAKNVFTYNADNPLACDLVVCDEASMLDAPLAAHLAEAIPPGAHLVLVGDVDQLPSIGPGNVLADLIASGRVHVVRLDKIFRQAAQSRIVLSAHDIRRGRMPELAPTKGGDFFFIEQDDPVALRELVVDLVARRLPQTYNLDPLGEIMVLAPMHKGEAGVAALNEALRARLNPAGAELIFGERSYRLGDKVMQTANDYDREIYNGDIGRVARVDEAHKEIIVDFDGRLVSAREGELADLVHAYAVSIHKSQGSEYPCVIVPLHTQHFILLARNLLYTAITRGKKLVVACGSRRALARAVENDAARHRTTLLINYLESARPNRLL